ncbi:IS110 family transposase [Mucilaginibacter jinjuensis]|uniref:IS110 family transposase n=1 Tax=Mucilaginibacter jinjuensis TaxID=1176721 RepID=A0ABY7TD93_9SPHI|nr:IS110 family transposase [Mucilaginibacter jinjuensis]WCT14431.1 IS110 family transposase [Mucilaginibacter jinjuensis]
MINTEPIKLKKYTYFIGIDISRNELDFAVMQDSKLLFHKEIPNQVADIKLMVTELKGLPKFTIRKAAFCMEQTGIYSNHLKIALKSCKANIIIEDALHIRSSLGTVRGKYDKIDAIRIAQYGYKNREHLRVWQPRRLILEQLAHLSTLRNRLINVKTIISQQLNEDTTFVNKKILNQSRMLCSKSTGAISLDVTGVDEFITELVKSDPYLMRMHDIITSVPCVGTVTAIQIIITSNELRDINDPKKYACYAGVVPFKRESGVIQGKAKVSKLANKRVKALLHTCALNAIRHDPELKAYFERKHKEEGKPKMAVLNAVRNKLVLRIFACLNQDREYEPNYKNKYSGDTNKNELNNDITAS